MSMSFFRPQLYCIPFRIWNISGDEQECFIPARMSVSERDPGKENGLIATFQLQRRENAPKPTVLVRTRLCGHLCRRVISNALFSCVLKRIPMPYSSNKHQTQWFVCHWSAVAIQELAVNMGFRKLENAKTMRTAACHGDMESCHRDRGNAHRMAQDA